MKYKLKKLLPFENSPKIGYISEPHCTQKDGTHYWNNNWFNPKNYPEFWEKVVEKDYEILSFIATINCVGDKYKTIRKPDKHYTVDDYLYKGCCVENGNYNIHSVKRLSDSQIFTIGDIIDTRVDNKYKQEILEINLGINNNFLKDKLIFKTKAGYVVIDIAIKTKQKLFTSEDSVDIFEGDKSYEVKSNGKIKNKPLEWFPSKHHLNHIKNNNLNFSTKEKAEEYILLNKPVLSLNDIKNLNGEYETVDRLLLKVEKLVKQKLK